MLIPKIECLKTSFFSPHNHSQFMIIQFHWIVSLQNLGDYQTLSNYGHVEFHVIFCLVFDMVIIVVDDLVWSRVGPPIHFSTNEKF